MPTVVFKVNDAINRDYLSGKRVVITGDFRSLGFHRADMARFVTSCGGEVKSTISGRIDLIIIGMAPGEDKLDRARNLGIPQWSFSDFQQFLEIRSGKEPSKPEPVLPVIAEMPEHYGMW